MLCLIFIKKNQMEQFDYDVIDTFKKKYQNEVATFKKVPKDCEILYNGEHGLLVVPKTVKAMSEIAKNTVWCISDPKDTPDHSFYSYSSNCYVYIDNKKNVTGWSIDLATGHGKFITQHTNKLHGFEAQESVRSVPPVALLFDLLEDEIMKDAKKAYYYSLTIIQGRWPKAEKIILTSEAYANKYIRHIRKKGEVIDEWENHKEPNYIAEWWEKKMRLFKARFSS
jgi:hypothetical protein